MNSVSSVASASHANLSPLSDGQLRDIAPAIFCEKPHSHRSEQYQFVPTIEMINFLREKDIFPVEAQQRRGRSDEITKTGVHIVKFSLENHFTDLSGEIPQIVLINSHDGSRAYNFSIGIFRLVCSNGLIVKTDDFGEVALRHRSDYQSQVFEMSAKALDNFSLVFPKVNAMKNRMMTYEESAQLANSAGHLRYGDQIPFDPKNLLEVRRMEDAEDNLWNVYNRVQENLIRGGFVGVTRANPDKPRKVRALSDLNATYNINRDLWEVAESFI